MKDNRVSKYLKCAAIACSLSIFPAAMFAQHYTQTNLVSDLATVDGQAVAVQDPNLKNPWGLARGASSPWWVNNEGTGTSTLYTGTGAIVASPSPVVVPNVADATAHSQPTGIIFNGTTDFQINNVPGKAPSPAAFIFATENGTISAWNPATTPLQLAVNEVTEKGAVFMGLTWIESEGTHFLLAANLHRTASRYSMPISSVYSLKEDSSMRRSRQTMRLITFRPSALPLSLPMPSRTQERPVPTMIAGSSADLLTSLQPMAGFSSVSRTSRGF
jgi:hypothetical protein